MQVRAKLFTFCKPGQKIEGAEKDGSGEAGVSAAGGKDGDGSWQVTGIGQLKINVPKQEGSGVRPRIIMRRQKTFQVMGGDESRGHAAPVHKRSARFRHQHK